MVESKAADYTSKSNFWTWSSQYTWGLGDQLLGMASDSVCTESEDEKHHASSYQYDAGDGYYRCVCQYCGETFLAYESDISSAYDDYVSALQTDLGTTTLINGGVRILFQPVETDWYFGNVDIHGITNSNGVITYKVSAKSANYYLYVYYPKSMVCPFDAYVTSGIYSSYIHPSSTYDPQYGGYDSGFHDNQIHTAGESMRLHSKVYSAKNPLEIHFENANTVYTGTCYAYFDLIPIGGLEETTTQDITINSRPTSITGDYGIIGDDGSITKIDGNMIVDESSSTVYNPVTNTTHNYTDYAYDYSDRSYNLTLEDGSTIKVVYGDENVTIEEGDTVYIVYYLTSGSEDGSGGSGDAGDDGSGGSGDAGDDGSGGSGDAGDDGSGGIGGAISGLFDVLGEIIYGLIEGTINLATKALSAMTGLLDLLKQFGESIVGFFGGYLDFLGAVFPFLPEETFTILNLGLILMIAAAVFKKFL